MDSVVQPLEPSRDFVYLISGEITPDLYGREPELDAQDREIWDELIGVERSATSTMMLRYLLLAAVAAVAVSIILGLLDGAL